MSLETRKAAHLEDPGAEMLDRMTSLWGAWGRHVLIAVGAPWLGVPPGGVPAQPITGHRALRYGLVTGVVWFIGTLYWLTDVMVTFGGLPTALAWFAALLLIVYLALFPGLAALVTARACARAGGVGLLVAPIAWTATEYLRGHLLTGFPWVLLGRALLHANLVAERNHARRESLALDAHAGAHLADGIDAERRRELDGLFRRLRNEREVDAAIP